MVLLLFPSCLLSLAGVALAAAGPSDSCLMLDSCYYKTEAKTCSCQPDCHLYGTCCVGAGEGPTNHSGPAPFSCYGRRTREPLFVRRTCKPGYRGHPHDGAACFDEDEDETDVVNNLLVTSRLTKVTYWNKQCAKCNGEDPKDLELWDIVVRADGLIKGANQRFLRQHLHFFPERRRWGVMVGELFIGCDVHYAPPADLYEIKYCNPKVIQTCPPDYPDREGARKCSQSYAERKLKSGDVYFRNVHCAICNGYDERELECTGMTTGPDDSADDFDFREVTEVVFSRGEWLQKEPGRRYECSPGYTYDPFRGKCRTSRTKKSGDIVSNSAPVYSRLSYLLLATLSAVLLL